ncbi:Aminopeptidase 2 mitochondrial [Boothiomyces sp. JEL0838]|nr:Aminopeptidase 2 mitochondrial [Boothiomyces sp. JEL0838]
MLGKSRLLPQNAQPTHYNLTLVPGLETAKFTGQVSISLTVSEATRVVVANVRDLSVTKASVAVLRVSPGGLDRVQSWPKDPTTHRATQNSSSIAIDNDNETVAIEFQHEIPAISKVVLHLEFAGTHFEDLRSFYRSSYLAEDGSKKYIVTTQFQAADARRCFPCWDEPNLKATFDVQLIVPKGLIALSNTEVVKQEDLVIGNKEMRLFKFATTPIMCTYLLAFCVGEFDYIEGVAHPKSPADAKPVTCRVYTVPGKKEQGRFALDVGIKTLEFFSEYFDIAYSIPKLDQIAVPEMLGAMENWGLVIYEEGALLVDPEKSSANSKKMVTSVICHELAHQWFGNLVTMDWWKELWLNEGFATYVGTFAVDYLFPEWKSFDKFILNSMNRALVLDGLRSSHPIEVEVNTPKDIDQIFDGISYAKGASVIRLISSYLGPEVFMNGVRIYLKRFAFKNATTIDLWNACSEASGKDIAKIMKEWTEVMGYPMVTILDEEYDETAKKLTLTLEQKRFLSTGDLTEEENTNGALWSIPFSVLTHEGEHSESFLLDQKVGKITFDYEERSSSFWKLNSSCHTLFRVNYSDAQLDRIIRVLSSNRHVFTVADRLELLMDVFAFAEAGLGSTLNALNLLKEFSNETDITVLQKIREYIDTIKKVWVSNKSVCDGIDRLASSIFYRKVLELGYEFKDETQDSLRTLAISVTAGAKVKPVLEELHSRYLKFRNGEENAFHPNICDLVFNAGSTLSQTPMQDFEFLYNIYLTGATSVIKVDALRAIGNTNDFEIAKLLVEKYLFDSDKVKSGDVMYLARALIGNNADFSNNLLAYIQNYVVNNWTKLYELYKTQPYTLSSILVGLLLANLNRPMVEFMEGFVNGTGLPEEQALQRRKETEGISRALAQNIEKAKTSLNWLERENEKVERWFSENE